MLKMTFLEQLYCQMKTEKISQCLFSYGFNRVEFSVIFDIETTPFALLFGIHKENVFFSFNIERGFVVKETNMENSAYKQLVKILQLKFDPDNKFSPVAFLKTFNLTASVRVQNMKQAEYFDRAPFFSDVEEADKVYFQKWLVHHGERSVTEKNLEKTRKWLGEVAYNNCKKRNISSCWTANKVEATDPHQAPW